MSKDEDTSQGFVDDRRKDHRRVVDALTVNKEIPIVWLASFLVGGIANFAAIVWIASTLVHDVSDIKSIVKEHELRINSATVDIATVKQVQINTSERLNNIDSRMNGDRLSNDSRFNRR